MKRKELIKRIESTKEYLIRDQLILLYLESGFKITSYLEAEMIGYDTLITHRLYNNSKICGVISYIYDHSSLNQRFLIEDIQEKLNLKKYGTQVNDIQINIQHSKGFKEMFCFVDNSKFLCASMKNDRQDRLREVFLKKYRNCYANELPSKI